jgi:glycerate kinase
LFLRDSLTGQLILDVQEGFKNIALFIGGSATNDGGMAAALGYQFYDSANESMPPIGKS